MHTQEGDVGEAPSTDLDEVQTLDEAMQEIVDRALDKTEYDSLGEVPPEANRQRGRSVPCGSCNGMGRTRDGSFCSCDYGQEKQQKHTKRIRDTFRSAGVPSRLRKHTLASWDEKCGGEDGKARARGLVREIIEDGTATGRQGTARPGLLLYGDNGIGKTGLMSGLLKRLFDQGHAVLWIKWSGMIDDVQATYDGSSQGTSTEARVSALQRVSHLFLDDFGEPFRSRDRWRVSDDRRDITWQVLSARHEEDKPTFITTNHEGLTPISDQFSPRIADRIMEMCTVAEMSGRNLRHPSNQ